MATVAAVHSQPPVVRTPAQVIDSLFQTDTPAERPSGQSLAASGYGQASPPARTRSSTTSRPRSPAHVLHPDGSREAEAFVRQRAERILCGMVSQVVKGLRQTVTKRRLTGQKAKTIRGVADYLYSNRERMRYDHYLANGWPIASGIIEGACKTSSATDSNAPACAGRSRPPKHCCAYAPPTSPATTTTTADTTSQPTKPAYTATTTGKSS